MKALVIGGAGYIGSHTVLRLRERGITPVIYDNFSTGHRYTTEGFEVIDGDIADYERVRLALKGIDAIVHFAARAYVGESVLRPNAYYTTNVIGGLNLLNAALDEGITKFVFSSSCAVYGSPDELPIDECTPRNPLSPYGLTKAAFEDALKCYSAAYGIKFVALRYFNAAGADEAGGIGELHFPETHLIPLILQAAAGRNEPVSIFGVDYDTPDGTCIRDYVHVNDLASAHVSALEFLMHGGGSDFINLGTGTGVSVMNVVLAAEQVTGLRVPRNICPRRPGDPAVVIADADRAREKLHWSPSRGLAEILQTAWRWQCRVQGAPLTANSAANRTPMANEGEVPYPIDDEQYLISLRQGLLPKAHPNALDLLRTC